MQPARGIFWFEFITKTRNAEMAVILPSRPWRPFQAAPVSRLGVISEHRSGAYLMYASTGAQEIAPGRPPERLETVNLALDQFPAS
jgi:hypothetical protein